MALFHFEIHQHIDPQGIEKKLEVIIKKLNTMGQALEDIKAKLAASNEKIDILSTATEGVAADIAFIKAKLEAAGEGSIDPAGVAELLTIATAQDEKLATLATRLSDVDSQTDSTGA